MSYAFYIRGICVLYTCLHVFICVICVLHAFSVCCIRVCNSSRCFVVVMLLFFIPLFCEFAVLPGYENNNKSTTTTQ